MLVTRKNLSAADVAEVEKRVKRFAKAAAKAGRPEDAPTVESVEESFKDAPGAPGRKVRVYKVTLSVPAENLCREGYRLGGIVQTAFNEDVNSGDARVVTILPAGEEAGLSSAPYREGNLRCDGCGTKRRRKTVLLVVEEATGKVLTFGTECAAEYVPSLKNSTKVLEYVAFTFRDRDPETDGYGRYEEVLELEHVLSLALFVVAEDGGYRPKGHPDGSTVNAVHGLLNPPGPQANPEVRRAFRETLRRYEAKAEKLAAEAAEVVTWVREGNAGTNDYALNLAAAFSRDYVADRTFGLVVSAPYAWKRQLAKAAERKAGGAVGTVYVGAKGERKTWKGTLLRQAGHEGYYGLTTRVEVATADGGLLVWWKSGSSIDFNEGDEVELTGRVKKLDSYNGKKQTVVTRCKVTSAAA